jgi:hypothetical protein
MAAIIYCLLSKEVIVYYSKKLDEILTEVRNLTHKVSNLEAQGKKIMALGQQILDALGAVNTTVDSFLALVQGLIDNNTIPPDVGANIISAITAEKAKVDAAIVANTPPAPPAPQKRG